MMDTILKFLFECFQSEKSTPEEQAILRREMGFLNAVEDKLGEEEFERLWDTMFEITKSRTLSDFRLGLWLGANLTLLAKEPPFPQK